LFVGSIPKEILEQAIRVIRIDTWNEAFICCSGSFRIERALHEKFPNLRIHSNDVSLLTCSIGQLATGKAPEVHFVERLAFIERELAEMGASPQDRVAAVLVALDMGKYAGSNAFARAHFAHYERNFRSYLDHARVAVAEYLDGLRIDSFFGGDFREHAKRGLARGAGVIAWPPTYKGGYERLYKFLRDNTRWPEP
jgi:hypothetical protein